MRVSELMTAAVEWVGSDATVQEAAERMKALDVGVLPVCEDNRLVGVVTDRDITVRSVSDGRDPWTDHVRDAMTPKVIYCFEDQEVEEAAELMKDMRIRRLPVLNRDQQLVGIVSLGDLAVLTGNDQLTGETLERISEPPIPRAMPIGPR